MSRRPNHARSRPATVERGRADAFSPLIWPALSVTTTSPPDTPRARSRGPVCHLRNDRLRHVRRRVDAVEQELERPVRLPAERDLGPEQIDLALPHGRLDYGRAALEIVLPPRPTAAQRRRAVEPRDGPRALERRVGRETEHGAVVEEDIEVLVETRRHWIGVVDRDVEDRARHIVLLAGERSIRLARAAHDEVILDRQVERESERRRRPDRDDDSAV